jgi:thiamine-phosphate pyrophosphorylase
MRSVSFDVLLITDPQQPRWLEAVLAAVQAAPPGRLAVEVRNPDAGAAELLRLARGLRDAIAGRAPILVNDRVDVALAAGASGVHLKETGLEVADARLLLPPGAWVGASCHDEASLARRSDADYVVLGPVGEVPGKLPPLGFDRFAALVVRARPPVLALGGIDAANAGRAIAAGAHGIAVVRAIQAAPDPVAAVGALFRAIDAARNPAPARCP